MTVCWHWWRTGDLYVPHRCQQPQGHPGPHICNCNTTTTNREIEMTDHPAKPKGYKPFRDPAQIEADTRADERAKIAARLRTRAADADSKRLLGQAIGYRRAAAVVERDA